jgi:hypothetical protein
MNPKRTIAGAVPERGLSSKSTDIVVFWIVGNSVCADCGEALGKGRFLRLESERPLCLDCADLAHLVFLERGDAALTRRAIRYSTLHAVVVRFSRARKRYERQGVLVEEQALSKAELECLSDARAREAARERAAGRRLELDAAFVEAFGRRVGELFPGCPRVAQQAIAAHACKKYSGRVGRSAAAKDLDANAVELAVRAHVRHAHTPYDRLLADGMDRFEARREVAARVDEFLKVWASGLIRRSQW